MTDATRITYITNQVTNLTRMLSNNKTKLIYPELSFKIIGITFRVYNDLGYGYQEKYYQKAIALDFDKEKLKYVREIEVKLEYRNEKIGKYFIDFIVENKIVLELKVGSRFRQRDIKQVLSYLKATGHKLGIIILITPQRVQYKRIINL